MSRTRRTTQFSGEILNKIQIKLPALSVNESMARAAVAAFVSQLDPGVTEIADIKCAVSEAVTNAIVHGYRDTPETGSISITVSIPTATPPRRGAFPSPSPSCRAAPSRSRSRTRAAASPTWGKPASPSTPPTPRGSGAAWDLPSWRASPTP